MVDKRKGVLVVGGLGLAGLLAYLLARKVEAAPGLANLYISAIDESGVGSPDVLFTIDGISAYTDINGNCAFLELPTGPYSCSCIKDGYEVIYATLNGVEILFEGGIMDFELTQEVNQLTVVMKEVGVVPAGRIGAWGYYTTCAYPTPHAETGVWPNHILDFDYDLFPSTWYISVIGHNDSAFPVTAKLEIVGTNATIYSQASEQSIPAGEYESFSFSMGLPRVRGEYYFDAVLSFDGVVVAEGRWIVNYDAGVTLANLDIEVNDNVGNPMGGVLFRINSDEALTNPSGVCRFTDLAFGSHQGYCHKDGYEITSIRLNGVAIPVTDGYF